MYKGAKKKFNDEAIQEAIDIAKLNISRRKLRVNGFGKKFVAVIKVIKVEKANEKPNEVEKKSQLKVEIVCFGNERKSGIENNGNDETF